MFFYSLSDMHANQGVHILFSPLEAAIELTFKAAGRPSTRVSAEMLR